MGQITKVTPDMIQVANNVTSTSVGNTNQSITLTFDQNGVITAASNSSINISGANIFANTITGNKIAPNQITGNLLASNTVSNTNIQTGAIEVYSSSRSTGLFDGMRNRIINGAMQIWQRGTSFTSGGSATYTADRFFGNGSSGTISQSTDVPTGFTYSFSNAASSTAYPGVSQRIESVNIADCASQVITVSFYAKQISGTASALNINLAYPTAVDNYSSSTTIVETNVVAAMSATWTRYSYTYTLPANVTNGLSVTLFIPSGSITATFLITGVQLEKGSTATSFDYRPFGTELVLCQRYFQIADGYAGSAYNTTNFVGNVKFVTTMRTSPTVGETGVNTITYPGNADYTQSSVSVSINGTTRVTTGAVQINLANFSGLTTNLLLLHNANSGSITLSAEL